MAYELEVVHRVYSEDGFYYEIGLDPDGLGNVEIKYFDDVKDKEPRQTITLTEESISLIIDALSDQLNKLKEKK